MIPFFASLSPSSSIPVHAKLPKPPNPQPPPPEKKNKVLLIRGQYPQYKNFISSLRKKSVQVFPMHTRCLYTFRYSTSLPLSLSRVTQMAEHQKCCAPRDPAKRELYTLPHKSKHNHSLRANSKTLCSSTSTVKNLFTSDSEKFSTRFDERKNISM